MDTLWEVFNSIFRMTSTFSIEDWIKTVACLTLLLSVYIIAAGSNR